MTGLSGYFSQYKHCTNVSMFTNLNAENVYLGKRSSAKTAKVSPYYIFASLLYNTDYVIWYPLKSRDQFSTITWLVYPLYIHLNNVGCYPPLFSINILPFGSCFKNCFRSASFPCCRSKSLRIPPLSGQTRQNSKWKQQYSWSGCCLLLLKKFNGAKKDKHTCLQIVFILIA